MVDKEAVKSVIEETFPDHGGIVFDSPDSVVVWPPDGVYQVWDIGYNTLATVADALGTKKINLRYDVGWTNCGNPPMLHLFISDITKPLSKARKDTNE